MDKVVEWVGYVYDGIVEKGEWYVEGWVGWMEEENRKKGGEVGGGRALANSGCVGNIYWTCWYF